MISLTFFFLNLKISYKWSFLDKYHSVACIHHLAIAQFVLPYNLNYQEPTVSTRFDIYIGPIHKHMCII